MKLIFMLVIIIGISALIGALCWPYSINTWLEYVGKEATVTGGHGALLGLVPGLGQLSLPVAAITWIVMLFLGT